MSRISVYLYRGQIGGYNFMDFLNLPKIDLHCHLDGSLRPGSVLELLRKYNIDLGINETNIDDALKIRDHCDSLLT